MLAETTLRLSRLMARPSPRFPPAPAMPRVGAALWNVLKRTAALFVLTVSLTGRHISPHTT